MAGRSHLPYAAIPRTHLLSNGRYGVMLTDAGSGYSHWGDLAVTRWREDVTRDSWGSYIFLRDLDSDVVWSAGYQPLGVEPDSYEVAFSESCAEIVRRDGTLSTTLQVAVAPECDGELRLVSVFNDGAAPREIDLTSYAELVLASPASDAAHPAFSKLFVQTEYLGHDGILLATRRRRAPNEPHVWAAHIARVEGDAAATLQYETDRARFLGRGRTLRSPAALSGKASLSGTVGTVLDPIFSLRRGIRVEPGATRRVAFWTLIGSSRDAVVSLAEKVCDTETCEHVFELAAKRAQTDLDRFAITREEAQLFQRLTGALLYSDASMRSLPESLAQGTGGPPTLWSCGVSGDRPIVLARIEDEGSLALVRQLLQAHAYWMSKRFTVDLVVINEAAAPAADPLQASLETLLQAHATQNEMENGAQKTIFALRGDQLASAVHAGLLTAARIVVNGDRASLAEQSGDDRRPAAIGFQSEPPEISAQAATAGGMAGDLEFFNGLGGFADDGREYVTILQPGQSTPAPWLNVIANPDFGFSVTAEGGGYTWALNSQTNPLTPWDNDPVCDTPQEAMYLRDEESGRLWTPTALPIREHSSPYIARHGKGYSRFEHTAHGIELALLQYVPVEDAIKITRLQIRNRSGRPRRLSVTAYVQWALGANGTQPAPFVVTREDAVTGALFAQNAWRPEFAERVAFIDLGGSQSSLTADRTEFLGRNGALDRPAALMQDSPLSGRVGARLDPCGALQTRIELAADAEIEVVVLLGEAADDAKAQSLIERYRRADLDAVLDEVNAQWAEVLGMVQVRTPDRAMDILLNHFLLYQTLACRVWARTAFYQASGAYGFRDQLQDVMALGVSKPGVTRQHLLRAAARQFTEGDVQHWWLTPSGQGLRTRMTDDRIWLPYVAAQYIGVTADVAVLDEVVPFIEGAALKEGEVDAFYLPTISTEHASLYEHCARVLDVSLALGARGLPLIGTGDWNDGMNRVGEKGRGESVWLAWFLLATIDAFAPHAETRGEHDRAARWRQWAAAARVALERAGWDGQWYRRGYYDDGTPLGSNDSSECKIDMIAQSWSVIADAADPAHAAQAMAAVEEHLIRRTDKTALLFTPPFDCTPLEPGYIKGYPPGIRENGGQYTHGAIWSIFAFAMQGQGDRAGDLLDILNPIRHSSTPEGVARYKVEPYVACADVYSVAPHVGRGGWTWYTGSAGWLYRAGLESMLGFRVQGNTLTIDPCVPKAWPGYEIVFHHRDARSTITRYEIVVENPRRVSRGIARAELDGLQLADRAARIPLVADGEIHRLRVVLG